MRCPHCGVEMTDPRRVQCGAAECKRKYINQYRRDWERKYREANGHNRDHHAQERDYRRENENRREAKRKWRITNAEHIRQWRKTTNYRSAGYKTKRRKANPFYERDNSRKLRRQQLKKEQESAAS